MKHFPLKSLILTAGLVAIPLVSSAGTPAKSASLTQTPVVMRLSKDEFRIAFGIDAAHCASSQAGCNGVIRYRVDWKTEDGTTRSELRRVNYVVAPRSSRSVVVDRQYFDTSEAAHTTDIVKVSVDLITCVDGSEASVSRTASLAAPHG